jgi:hypothetical protein
MPTAVLPGVQNGLFAWLFAFRLIRRRASSVSFK